jgi:choline dehydrogenase-like flavoprotein
VRHRANLTVATRHFVERLLIEEKRVVGVSCRHEDATKEIRCNREVILSAGSIQSPQILQLSGIGPGAHLKWFGIPVVVDSPGVGENLREHWMAIVQYRLKLPISQNFEFQGVRLLLHSFRYLLTKRGLMSTSSHEVNAFIRTDPSLDRPDAQLIAAPISLQRGSVTDRFAFENEHGIQIMAYAMRPESQGRVMIKSKDPAVQPQIHPSYLANEIDCKATAGAVRFVRRLASQAALEPYLKEETLPGVQARSDDEILDVVRRTGNCVYHGVGTCRMGGDPRAVVDFNLRVSGVSGLRVVDASIFPSLVSGQTNGPVMAVAWRAADLILADGR